MTSLVPHKSKVLVCQLGARHRYAIPRILEEEGMLAALYTDSTAFSLIGRLASRVSRMGWYSSKMGALCARIPMNIPREKVCTSDRPFYASILGNMVSPDLSKTFARWGLRGANVLYNMFGEHLSFLTWANGQGCKTIVDVFIHPDYVRTIADEAKMFLGEQGEVIDQSVIDFREHSRKTFAMADVLLCPSNWVAEGVVTLCPEYYDKIRIVPYGSSLQIRPAINETPVKGRILFAGRDPLRKGLHYLAEAAHLVRKAGLEIDVHVAGIEEESIQWMKHGCELRCIGQLPLDQMYKEYEQADIFILPSLTEGQAGVILEAMACGCPVIATRESGVDFEPGCGITVPTRNAEELAMAITAVISNRKTRNELARGALRQADSYSMEKWKERLGAVLQEIAAN